MNKIMATAALLLATTTATMATTAMAAPGHGADRYGHYVAPPSEYYGRAWHRGERFAPHRGRAEVLHGYGRRYGYGDARLYGPPRGAQWVRVNNDALLTAIATGVVLDVVYNLHF